MKRTKHKNKTARKTKLYWFGRAFTVTALLLSCTLAVLFGFGYCENKILQNKGAPTSEPVSLEQGGLYFYGHRIF